MNNVIKALSNSYVNNIPLDTSSFSQEDWDQFKEEFDFIDDTCQVRPGFESLNPSNEEIFDLLFDATNYYEFDSETICSFKNLGLALMCMTHDDVAEYIIANNVKFDEFIRFDDKLKVLPISELKFSDVEHHFKIFFEDWRTDDSIFAGSLLVRLCDNLGIKIEPYERTPKDWNIPEYEFKEFYEEHGDKPLREFARLFNKPMSQWYAKSWTSLRKKTT